MERVSHETIYQALYVQTRGGLRKDLYRQLSLKRRRANPAAAGPRGERPYAEAFTIADRPAEVADRAVPGHWEGDLMMGTGKPLAVGTLVERSTRFTILLHLPGRHDADSVAEAMIRQMSQLPEHLRRSLTWDRGIELADYQRIQLELDIRSTSATPTRPGSAAPTRTPTGCCGSGWRRAPTSRPHRSRPGPDRRHPQRPTPPYPGPRDPSRTAGGAADQPGSSMTVASTDRPRPDGHVEGSPVNRRFLAVPARQAPSGTRCTPPRACTSPARRPGWGPG